MFSVSSIKSQNVYYGFKADKKTLIADYKIIIYTLPIYYPSVFCLANMYLSTFGTLISKVQAIFMSTKIKQFLSAKNLFLFVIYLYIMQIDLFANTMGGPQNHGYPGGRLSVSAIKPKVLQPFDISTLNLKNTQPQHSVTQTNSAISIDYSDFNTISSIGNTWLLYQKVDGGFSMNIGIANSTTPQTWTLPSTLVTGISGVGRGDFINPNAVPVGLEISGANKVMRTYYFDNNDRLLDQYDHFFIDNDGVDHLGTSYDVEVGSDDNFDEEPDYEYADVPFDLGDNFSTTVEEKDYVSNQTLTKYVQNSTVDAFGTISTPDGVYECLRSMVTSQRYTRPDENTAYTLEGTYIWVSFLTKEGVYFRGVASSSSGTANISFFEYRKVVPTATLTEQNDVKLNNDSKGVTINGDNDTPHPSAILDVKSENQGILIPRIAKANRPASPALGLLIYQIDDTPGFYFYDGSAWQRLNSSTVLMASNNEKNVSARINQSENILPARLSEIFTGKGRLLKGATFIKFEGPIENYEGLQINIQLEGDCNGVFISKKTREGFEVKELQKGKSNAMFSWKIIKE